MPNDESCFIIIDGVLKEYKGSDNKVFVPNGVQTIGKRAFEFNRTVAEIVLPSTIETIEFGAFWGCIALENINLPQGISQIGASAFDGCKKIKNIEIPKDITEIKTSTFSGCKSLESVKLPEKLLKIERDAFFNCSRLSTVNIPATVRKIGACAFHGCKKLADISLTSQMTVGYHAFRETKWIKNYYKENDALIFGKTLVEANPDLKEYTVPDGVERIGDFAFCCNEAEKINLSDSVKVIGAYSFADSKIKEMIIPFGVKKIEEQAFYECKELESIFIPETVVTIENQALAKLPRATVTIMSEKEEMDIYESAFCGQELEVDVKEIRAPYGSKVMRCAMRMNIPFVALKGKPQKYTYINDVFCCMGTTLVEYLGHETEIFVPEGIEIIGHNAFLGDFCKEPITVRLPNSVTKIEYSAFIMCDTIENVYGHGVKTIESNAFRCCKNLRVADFPNVITVGYKAFSKCFNLEQTRLVEMQPSTFSIFDKKQ